MPKKRKQTRQKRRKNDPPRLAPGPPHTPPELLGSAPKVLDQDAFSNVYDEALREHMAGLTETVDLVNASEQFVNSLMAGVSKGNTPAGSRLALSHLIRRAFQALRTRVSLGDQGAAKERYWNLRSSVEQFISDSIEDPSAYLETAKANLQIPVLYSPHPHFSTDVDALQQRLRVADGYRLKVFGRWSDRKRGLDLDLPQNWLAFTILEKLISVRSTTSSRLDEKQEPEWEKECRQLPPLTLATADAWAQVGWKAVLHYYRGHPETDPYLAQLGTSLTVKAAGTVRGRIQSQFTQAIKRLAPPP